MDYGCEHPNIVEQDRERRVRLFELAMAGIIPWPVANHSGLLSLVD